MGKRADFYRGQTAQEYELLRSDSSIWRKEDEILDDLLAERVRPGRSILIDLPVGTGRFVDLYQRIGCSVIGVDISHEMITQAVSRNAPKARFVVATADEIPLRSGVADAAVCIRFVHLIDKSQVKRTLAELRRVIQHGGFLVVGARLHSFKTPAASTAKRVVLALLRQIRSARFRVGAINSRSHSGRRFLSWVKVAGFELVETREVTTYKDGSQYLMLVLRGIERAGHMSFELFGLPGVGKSTVARALVKSEEGVIIDGFKRIEPLSLSECIVARPVGSLLFLARLLPVLGQLKSHAAKRVVLAALRQSIVDSRTSGVTLYEEGVTHEVWRQLMTKERLSDELIRRVIPVAGVTIFLNAPSPQLLERLRSKASPGPVSRLLLDEPIEGAVWDEAIAHFERIKRIIHANRGRSVSVSNLGDVSDAMRALRQIIADQGE